MKISEIEIKHFRGFPGPSSYTFKLSGKNLLLYGENGSGKSSLYQALNQLFNIEINAPSFNANLFGKDENGNDVTDGYVMVRLDTSPPTSLTWSQTGTRPTDPISIDTAMRKGFLEYRSLLRTNFTPYADDNLNERLFHLAVDVLLERIPVPLSGVPRMLGDYWKAVRKPKTHHKHNLETSANAINQFNQALKAILPQVEAEATLLLNRFTGHHMKLNIEFHDLFYDKPTRTIKNQDLNLRVEFNGKHIPKHHDLLNEARLSSLALALFLASVKLSNPVPGPAVVSPLKLLVLDDVLIGLDLSNRLPLLDILENEFKDYQIILSTYDRVWFDLVHLQTQAGGLWVIAELYSDRFGDPGYEFPVLKTSGGYLAQAKEHYNNHDHRAATVYTRAAFENKLKNFCSDKHLPVCYDKDPHKISSEDLWTATLKAKKQDGVTPYVDTMTKGKIEALRKIVLNPLSHAGANSITKTEVEAAIKAVETLSLT